MNWIRINDIGLISSLAFTIDLISSYCWDFDWSLFVITDALVISYLIHASANVALRGYDTV